MLLTCKLLLQSLGFAYFILFCYAITIDTPYLWIIGRNETISWLSAPDDPPVFRPKVLHPTLLSQPMYLAGPIYTSVGRYYFVVPSLIPGNGYYIHFVNVNDAGQVYASSGTFEISQSTSGSGTGFPSPPIPETPGPGPPPIIITIFSTVTVPASVVTVTQTITSTMMPNTTALNTISRGCKTIPYDYFISSLVLIMISWTQM